MDFSDTLLASLWQRRLVFCFGSCVTRPENALYPAFLVPATSHRVSGSSNTNGSPACSSTNEKMPHRRENGGVRSVVQGPKMGENLLNFVLCEVRFLN